ncbi:MAG: hypothetical protein QXW45_06770 [Thermosphaera sp.]
MSSEVIVFNNLDELRQKLAGIYLNKGEWVKVKAEFDLLYPAEILMTRSMIEDRVIQALGKDKLTQYGFIEKSFMIFVTEKGYEYGGSGQAVYKKWHVYIEWVLEADPALLIYLAVIFGGAIATLITLKFVVREFKGSLEVFRQVVKESPLAGLGLVGLPILIVIAIILYMVGKK